MSLDTTALRVFRDRRAYEKMRSVPTEGLEEDTVLLIKDFGVYYKEFPEVESIETEEFLTWEWNYRRPSLDHDRKEALAKLLKQSNKELSTGMKEGILKRLQEAAVCSRVLDQVSRWQDGEEMEIYDEISETISYLNPFRVSANGTGEVRNSLEDILNTETDDSGFTLPWRDVQSSMRKVRQGDFGILGARVNTGKSSAIAQVASHWLPQVAKHNQTMDEKRTVLVLNNEGTGERLKRRIYQALLGATVAEMVDQMKSGDLHDNLRENCGGTHPDNLLVVADIHNEDVGAVEEYISNHKPLGVLLDMADNVKYHTSKEAREDMRIKALYETLRNYCVVYDLFMMVTSQLSADAVDVAFPTMDTLSDSKTGKPGTADFILMLGCIGIPDQTKIRYLSLAKNKLLPDSGGGYCQCEVSIDPHRSIFNDAEDV